MPFIIKQDNPSTFLCCNEETGEYSITTNKKLASRYPTEASAIVTLQDYDGEGEFYPDHIKR